VFIQPDPQLRSPWACLNASTVQDRRKTPPEPNRNRNPTAAPNASAPGPRQFGIAGLVGVASLLYHQTGGAIDLFSYASPLQRPGPPAGGPAPAAAALPPLAAAVELHASALLGKPLPPLAGAKLKYIEFPPTRNDFKDANFEVGGCPGFVWEGRLAAPGGWGQGFLGRRARDRRACTARPALALRRALPVMPVPDLQALAQCGLHSRPSPPQNGLHPPGRAAPLHPGQGAAAAQHRGAPQKVEARGAGAALGNGDAHALGGGLRAAAGQAGLRRRVTGLCCNHKSDNSTRPGCKMPDNPASDGRRPVP
jgi:hypothetical protein